MLIEMGNSKKLSKGIMAAFVASVLATGCSESTEVMNVSSIDQCVASTGDFLMCQQQWNQAQALHQDVAPRFVDNNACAESFGNDCQVQRVQNSDGSFTDVFVPMMAGMMIGNMMASNNDSTYRPVQTQPLYQEKERRGGGYVPVNTMTTAGGQSVSPGKSYVSSNVASSVPKASSTPIARGGFGMAARGGSSAS